MKCERQSRCVCNWHFHDMRRLVEEGRCRSKSGSCCRSGFMGSRPSCLHRGFGPQVKLSGVAQQLILD